MSTDKVTDTPPQTPAVGGPRFSEGLGLPPPAVSWPQDLPLRDGGAVSAGRYWTEAQMLAERERAHNAGFVEASRLHGQEIDRLRSALTWALGANGDFRQQGTMDGAYWWRGELAERAGLEWDGVQYVSKRA